MHRIFVEKGTITHFQEIEEASIELNAAIRLCLAKKIFQEGERDREKIDQKMLFHLKHIVGKTRPSMCRRRSARLPIPLKEGRILLKPTAVYLWNQKLWAEDAAGDWYNHEEMTINQQQEFHEVADSRQKEMEKIMSSIGQDYISHVRAGKRLEAMFPPEMGGIHQGVSTLRQQINREDYPTQPEWTRGENIHCGAWLIDYTDVNEHDRTTQAWNQLNCIERESRGDVRLHYLCQLYQSLRKLMTLKKRNRLVELISRFTIQLPPEGDIDEGTRKTRLVHRFGREEQESPRKNELCLNFLQNITDIIRWDKPIQTRIYGKEDARLLVKANVDQKLWRQMENLSYTHMINYLVMRYVQTDIQDILVEVIGARKPMDQTWNEYLKYILSMTEMTRGENEDEGEVQTQLTRLIILTQLDTATRNLVFCKENLKSSRFSLIELCDYLDVNYVKDIQVRAMGGMAMITPPKAMPLVMTSASFDWNLEHLELKLQTNDYNWIGRRATLTGKYLDGIALPLSGMENVRVEEDFTCQIPWESFKLPDKSHDGGRVKIGTIVAHLLGARLYQVRCTVREEAQTEVDYTEIEEFQGYGLFEGFGEARETSIISPIYETPEKAQTEDGEPLKNSANNLNDNQKESLGLKAKNLEEPTYLQTAEELMNQAMKISDRAERLSKKLIAVLISRLETKTMSDRQKWLLREKIEEVINEERPRIMVHIELEDALLDDMVNKGEKAVLKYFELKNSTREKESGYET